MMPKQKTKPTPHQDAVRAWSRGYIELCVEHFLDRDDRDTRALVEECEEQGILAAGVVFHLMQRGKTEEAASVITAMIDSLTDPEDDPA